jgi:cellulose synthase/poly-beta-1,6-N-acetylglucosamine synthase-like glycosyltransferase
VHLPLLFAACVAVVAILALLQLAWGYLNIPSLRDVPPQRRDGAPRVSVIVAARNEERHIGVAVASLLTQSYPSLELIVVDDRSDDDTPRILRDLAATSPPLRVVRIDELPDGWLGKNNALQRGAEAASGDLLVFADADVVMDGDAVARAVRLATVEGADHLAVAPTIVLPTWPLALVVNYFMMWFLLWLRPWRARDPLSHAFIGIGAFNLVRASAFTAVGGFSRIALRPDDDIMLGKLLKRGGHRQLLASADGLVRVEWYRTLRELALGFRKNAFAGMDYSVLRTAAAVLGNAVLCVWPFIAMWTTTGAERGWYATAGVAQMIAYVGPAVVHRTRPWLALLYPIAAVMFVTILTAAVTRTLRRGGIEWRGTFYPLNRLRANRV